MTDRQALLRAVLAAPADDLPRLVFADWLDDRGEAERAAYVRASVALAQLVEVGDLDADGYAAAVAAVASVPNESLWGWAAAEGFAPFDPGLPVLARETVGAVDWVRLAGADLSLGFVRGFVGAVRCRVGMWETFGRGWAAATPLERVELTDRRPYPHRPREWVWRLPEGVIGGPSNVLPMGVFARLPGKQSTVAVYRTQREAEDVVSAACLVFARGAS